MCCWLVNSFFPFRQSHMHKCETTSSFFCLQIHREKDALCSSVPQKRHSIASPGKTIMMISHFQYVQNIYFVGCNVRSCDTCMQWLKALIRLYFHILSNASPNVLVGNTSIWMWQFLYFSILTSKSVRCH